MIKKAILSQKIGLASDPPAMKLRLNITAIPIRATKFFSYFLQEMCSFWPPFPP
jgi:hypothetical protein